MKIQDFSFFTILIVLLVLRRPRLLVAAGLSCLVLAIPLFYFHIFFTAEKLTWYAGGLFLTYVIIVIASEPLDCTRGKLRERGDLFKRLPRRPSTTLGTPRNDRKK